MLSIITTVTLKIETGVLSLTDSSRFNNDKIEQLNVLEICNLTMLIHTLTIATFITYATTLWINTDLQNNDKDWVKTRDSFNRNFCL